jgi:purine nucleosidase
MRMIFDTDIGTDVDDALALALAARSPEVDLLAVTTNCGDPALRARIARKILSLAGRDDVPVAAGCGPVLLRTAPCFTMGHEGQGILESETDGTPYAPQHAVDLLVDRIREAPEKPTIVTIGPVTNIALAIIKEPWIIDRVAELVIMGGCLYPERVSVGDDIIPPEFAPRMEHNLGSDPEAAQVVLGAGIPTILVPVEVTNKVWLTESDRATLREAGTPLTHTLSAAVDIWIEAFRSFVPAWGLPESLARAYLHDPLAVVTAFDQRFVELEPMHVRVELGEPWLRTIREPGEEPNAEVAVSVDAPAFRAFFLERVCGL